MKILLGETTKEDILAKNDGAEVSRYSFKNLLDDDFTYEDFKKELDDFTYEGFKKELDDFTYEDFKKEIDDFNITLAQQEEFTNIKELSTSIKIHNW